MKSDRVVIALLVIMITGLLRSAGAGAPPAPDVVMQFDRKLSEAIERGEKLTVEKFLDQDFTATDSKGETRNRAEMIANSSNAADDDGAESNIRSRTYGDAALILTERGKVHIGRVWVKRSLGWRLLVYQATRFSLFPSPPAVGVTDCENPCKSLPFKPKTSAEQAVLTSWQALETAVTNHDAVAWSSHVSDDFLLIGSMRDRPFTKHDRADVIDKQKANNTPSAPAPLLSARMFDFGRTIVMTATHQPFQGNPVHVVRIWTRRDGTWKMAFSQQTAIANAQNAFGIEQHP